MTVEIDSRLTEALPFETKQQDAILGYALTDRNFLLQIKDRVKPNWFEDGWTGKAYDYYVKFFDAYGHEPKSDDELFLFEPVYIMDGMERQKLRATIIRARSETNNFSLDVLKASLTGWLKSRIYHRHVSHSATLFNNRKFTQASSALEIAVRELQEVSFEGSAAADWTNPSALVDEMDLAFGDALTLGHPVLDRILNPDNPNRGSLLPGDATVLLAPTNVGKTTASITIMCNNLMAGKSAIFVAHEGRKLDLQLKIWQSLLNVSKAQYRTLVKSTDPKVMGMISSFANILSKQLVFIHDQKPGNTVESVVSMIRQHQQRRKGMNGKGFDLLINDYPALLGTEERNIVRERRQKDAYVYRYLVDYVGEQAMHGLFSIQTNREGSKKNRRTGEYANKKVLTTLEDVQEAFEVTNCATTLATLNASPEDQQRGLFTFLFCKSRSSETNIAVACKSNMRNARTHDPAQPATWWKGTDSLDQLDSLLSEYSNQEVPFDYKERKNAITKS